MYKNKEAGSPEQMVNSLGGSGVGVGETVGRTSIEVDVGTWSVADGTMGS